MDDRATMAWLLQRAGFGPAPGQLDTDTPQGVGTVLDRLVDPTGWGVAAAPDPFAGIDLEADGGVRKVFVAAIATWVDAMGRSPRPLQERMAWFWHGHFVSTAPVVPDLWAMVTQIRRLRNKALGRFDDLVRGIATDAAMLHYLNGNESTGASPNENFGRELMELFTLGRGTHTEADVKAAARALTGWVAPLRLRTVRFVPSRHDDRHQTLLGVKGVHDVDTVVDAVCSNKACAPFIAGKVAAALLGPGVPAGVVTSLATGFRTSGLDITHLVRSTLEVGVEAVAADRVGGPADPVHPVVASPIDWFVTARRTTQATADASTSLRMLEQAGQVPMAAPNVGGWPSGAAWHAAATVVARHNLAVDLAARVPDGPARRAAAQGNLAALADALGRPQGFSAGTVAALGTAPRAQLLSLALASPDLALR